MTATSSHRKQIAISARRCANPTAFRRESHTAYGVICPDGKVFSTLRDAEEWCLALLVLVPPIFSMVFAGGVVWVIVLVTEAVTKSAQ